MVKKIKVINLIEDEIKTEAEELNSIVEEMANLLLNLLLNLWSQ